jgi:hypothetical protein
VVLSHRFNPFQSDDRRQGAGRVRIGLRTFRRLDGARYDIISMLGKRDTVVTSRFVDAISAGVGLRPLLADIVAKVFLGDERNFLGPLMRFVCGDLRDLIVSHKTTTDLRIGATERCSGRGV